MITVIDSTVANPYNCKPIDFGIDLVVHSVTKYLSGHSDLVAAAVCGRQELVDKIWSRNIMLGNICSPFESWLILRGLRTFALRAQRINENAMLIAEYLSRHPCIEKVNYPGLPSHPQFALAKTQMKGFGGVMSFLIKDGEKKSKEFLKELMLPRHAPSLGGVETLVIQPVKMLSKSVPSEEYIRNGVRPDLIRPSIGIENAGEIVHDLEMALDKVY